MFNKFKTKKTKIKADEFDFGDDFMFDFDSDVPPPPKTGREAVTELGQDFLRGGTNYLKSEAFIRKQLDDHFPKGFGQTLDITGKASDSIRTLYDTAEKELKPAVNDLRKITSKILPKADKLLPKGLKAKLDQFASGYEDEYANSGRGDQREGLLQSSLNDMFRFQIEQAAGAEANGMARQQLSEVMSSVRHGESVFQLDAIRRSVSIMEQYHTKITVGYQRRSLELQTRQYYVAQEQLEETKRMLTLQSRELAAIRNNTGLPEYVKLNNSERLAEHLRNRFMGSATNAMFGAGADFLPKLMDRMVKKGVDKITEIASSGTMLTGMVTSGLDQAEAFGMSNPVNSVAEGAGAEGIGYLANKLFAKHIAPRVKNAEGIQKLGNNLAYGINNAGSLANEWASGDHPNLINRQVQSLANRLPQATPLGEEADGVKGWFQKRYQDVREGLTSADIENGPLGGFFDFLRENVKEELDVNNKLFANTPDNLNKPTSLSHAGLRSLTEIIPGLLSRQLRELQIIRTGDTSIGLTQYDLLNGKFANEQEMDVSLSKVLFNEDLSEKNKGLKDKDKLKSVNDSLQGLLKLVGADSLSPEQQRDLRNALIDRSIDKKSVSKAFLTDPASFKSQHGAVFSQLFSKHLEDDKMGIKHGEFADAFNTLGAGTNINFESVQNLVNAGYGQQLEDMGIIRDGRIDYRQYAKILINGQGERKQKVKATEPLNTNPLMQAVNQQPAQPAEPVQIKQEFNKTRNVNQNLNVDMSSVTERLDKYSVKTEMQTVVDLMTKIHQSFVEGLLIKGFGNGDENRKDPKWYQKSLLAGIGDLIGGTLGLGKKAAGGLWESGKYTGRMMAKAGSWGIGKGLAIGKGAIGMAGSAVNKAFGDFHDIYLPGSNEPIMEAWKLKAGHYASSINNKLIIKKPKDFQKVVALGGTIIDLTKRLPTGFETVCKASDLENAVIVKRNGGAVKLSAIAGKLFKTAYQTGNAMLRGMGGLGRMASSALAFAGKHLGLMLDGPMDVYVPGEQSPRLLAVVMRNGGYTSGTTGNVISKVSQIDGDVKYNGETVLTVDELRKGVVDKNGKAIKLGQGALGKLASLTGGLLKGGYKAIMKGAKMVGNFLMGGMGLAKDFLKGVFGEGIIVTSKRTISVLEEIKAILEERLPKSKSAFGDTDGDGIREGSVADLRKKRAALAAKAREAANAPGGTAAKAGVGGTLKAAWDKMRAKEEQEARDEEAEDSWLEMAGDAADIADFANGDGGGEGDERKGKGKKPGRMRRAGRYAKGKAGQAGRLLGRGAKGIGKGLWGATKAVGRGIGSTARNIPGGKATGALAIGLGGLAAYDI
ncbi:MAG: hypothetical protein NTZ16_16440, partial [Verrucomicrobia bacterium]|nr:hypothetical protein [Verrucomicrobiota bacterium]